MHSRIKSLLHTVANDFIYAFTPMPQSLFGLVSSHNFFLQDLQKPHAERNHRPLPFCSGRFNGTQLGWSILEKESYDALTTLQRMHWLVSTSAGFDFYTDHNNLIFLFDSLSVVPDLTQNSVRKELRWAVRLGV